jgi:hypothetical protein
MNVVSKIRHNAELLDVKELTKEDMEKLIIEAIPDGRNWAGEPEISGLYKQWEKMYWDVRDMKKID